MYRSIRGFITAYVFMKLISDVFVFLRGVSTLHAKMRHVIIICLHVRGISSTAVHVSM